MALGDGIRRNIATISDEERALFISAIRQLDDPTSAFVYPNNAGHEGADASGNITYWDMQEQIHKDAHAHGSDVHGGPAFAPWHRVVVNRLEALLRQVEPRLSLHYWDWTTDPRVGGGDVSAILGPSGFMGSVSGNAGAPFADFESSEKQDTAHGGDGIHDHVWREVGAGPSPVADDLTILGNGDFTSFNTALQTAHNDAHGYIGGTLGNAHFSFHDPIVFLLHSNMDRLWATWQHAPGHAARLNPASAYGTVLADEGLPTGYFDEWVEPWSGVSLASTVITDLNPWRSDPSQQAHISYLDPSIIIPHPYDTAPHTSYLVTNRDTFSTSEVSVTPNYPSAIFVVYDGFEPQEVGTPTATRPAITFTNAATNAPLTTISAVNPIVSLEDPGGAADIPQRVTIAYDIHFANSTEFPSTSGGTLPVKMQVRLPYTLDTGTAGAVVNIDEVAVAHLLLVNQPNPYMVDVEGSNPSWLSVDTRVFQRKASDLPLAGVSQADIDGTHPDAANDFAKAVVAAFNNWPAGRSDPSHPFQTALSQDENASHLELSRSVGGQRVYNYAVAKVRYLAPATVDATDVRVFFRAFSTMFSALDYDHTSGPSGNYRRSGSTPLLGIQGNEIASIPFFASPRINTATASLTTQADDAATNTQTIGGAAAEQVAYFGCWLDINLDASDPHGLQFPTDPTADAGGRDGPYSGTRQTIQNLIRGHHQCLVAEVFFQPAGTDPIPTGATPASSDRLAQRNLAIVESGNPGWPETHTIQHTFQLKASSVTTRQVRTQGEHPAAQDANRKAALFEATGDRAIGPDELMIQWNNVPRDSVATFYLPEIDVDEILELADLRQHPAVLEKIDAHTLRSRIADRTFIPLPGNRPGYLAGLISLTLPAGITTGQVYKLSLQQYSGINHKVLGAFQITIPVRTDPEILPNEIRKLSVLRSIQQTIPTGSRWHSIFIRYLDQIAERVRGLGGDPDAVRPSPDGGDRGDTKPCLPSKPVRIDPDDLISLNIPWSECEIEGELELKLRFRRRCE